MGAFPGSREISRLDSLIGQPTLRHPLGGKPVGLRFTLFLEFLETNRYRRRGHSVVRHISDKDEWYTSGVARLPRLVCVPSGDISYRMSYRRSQLDLCSGHQRHVHDSDRDW